MTEKIRSAEDARAALRARLQGLTPADAKACEALVLFLWAMMLLTGQRNGGPVGFSEPCWPGNIAAAS